jgi:opacity protein-like surface antigen
VQGQDSIRKREVSVTSTFKPTLKEAAKINLDATPPYADTTRPRLQYDIPNQNLLFAYQPGTLKPLALGVDTAGIWPVWNYAKLGYGSLSTPYFETGLSLGNGKTAGLNIYGKHISSKGKIEHQKFSNTDVEFNGFIQTGKNIEWNGRFLVSDDKYNKYGFQPKTINITDDSLKVKYQTWSTRVSFHNINRTELGISYSPEINLDVFNDRLKNNESNAYFNIPVRKTLGGNFEAEVALEGSLVRYSPDAKKTIKNNYFSLAPSLFVKTKVLNLQAGIRPSWDNGFFKLLPNIMAEASSEDKRITIQAGWIGYLQSNTFRSLAEYNPWIWAPGFSNNSRIEEIYGGIKGAVTDHFNYNLKLGYNKITNQQYFINDTMTGKSFLVVNDPEARAFNFKGELGYTVGEKFTLNTGLALKRFINMDDVYEKPFGIPQLEFNTNIRLQILKDLYVKGDLSAFDAVWYQTKDDRGKLKGGMDLSAGLEFAVYKNVKLWAQFNNILNNEYQRWRQYPVYGFNFLGGVVFSFAQNNK